jgi:hypothetical protein
VLLELGLSPCQVLVQQVHLLLVLVPQVVVLVPQVGLQVVVAEEGPRLVQ